MTGKMDPFEKRKFWKPSEDEEYHYCLLSNIPNTFHSADLRNFFAVFTEAEKFSLFHFRHRPQTVETTTTATLKDDPGAKKTISEEKFCCPIRFSEEKDLNTFIRKYNGKFWIERGGRELGTRALISKVNLNEEDMQRFSSKEFRPPSTMPRGNIGTPNGHFLSLIKACKLPPSLIKKLGLEFPRGRVFKKYSKVPYDYGGQRSSNYVESKEEEDEEEEEVTDAHGRTLSSVGGQNHYEDSDKEEKRESDQESNADDDDDRCEEWERHVALNDHRSTHGNMFDENKERLFEEKIELKWEKGGSGLVFYTDAQFWEAQEEDHDDWDVDMEGYYVPGGGDKDARDFLEMRRSERFQQGLEDISVFKRKPPEKFRRPASPPASKTNTKTKTRFKYAQTPPKSSKSPNCASTSTSTSTNPSSAAYKKSKLATPSSTIGSFEKYTRGIGRKIMESSGWTDGEGLGSTIKGMPDALDESEGQGPADKRGFGFYGEKLKFTTKSERSKRKGFHQYTNLEPDHPERIIIGTIYDRKEELDVEEPLMRRNATTHLKRYGFVKGKEKLDGS